MLVATCIMAIHVKLCCCYTHGASKKNLTICSDHVVAGIRLVARDPLRSFVSPKSAGMAGTMSRFQLPSVSFTVSFTMSDIHCFRSPVTFSEKPAEPGLDYTRRARWSFGTFCVQSLQEKNASPRNVEVITSELARSDPIWLDRDWSVTSV